jgi:hypothetical protein
LRRPRGSSLPPAAIGAALADRMTESVITAEADLAKVLGGHGGAPRPLAFVALGTDGPATLRAASTRLGLALATTRSSTSSRATRSSAAIPPTSS